MNRTALSLLPILSLCATTIACGASDDEADPTVNDPTDPTDPRVDGPDDPGPTDGPPDVTDDGPQWAPGTADPCVNPLDTGYLNDELCLEPPPPEVGWQTHFGPDDYDNPDVVGPFLLAPGAEDVVCQFRYTPDFEGVRYTAEQHTRLRQGTHHMILWTANRDLPNAPADGTFSAGECQNPFDYIFATGSQAALSDEGGILDIPLPGGDPPENDRTAKLVHPNRSSVVEMHYVNTTSEPILREGWINTIYVDESDVDTLIDPMFFIGAGINVPVGGSQIVTNDHCEQPAIPADAVEPRVRLLGMTGHAHANTTRITAWINRAATGQRERIYEAYNWAEPINAQFSSMHQNPAMGDGINDGAHTGILSMEPGDTFGWECEIHNQQDVVLRFGNLAYEAEMCNVFGFAVPGNGGMWACFR